MGLLDSIFGGGGGTAADDPYADILTPAQRNQMQVNGLLAMAGAFADAGMPSRLPIPFGSALGKAAQALGAGQEAGMKTAIENALAAQKVRDLRGLADYRKKTLGDLDPTSPLSRAIAAIVSPGGTAPAPGAAPGASPPAGTYAGTGTGAGRPAGAGAPAAADAPLTMDLPYPASTGGGLLGSDVGAAGEYGGGQTVGGLLGPASPVPPVTSIPGGTNGIVPRGAPGPGAAVGSRDQWEQSAPPGYRFAVGPGGKIGILPIEDGTSGSSSGAPAEPPSGAGGDEPWGPTFPQQAASRGPASGDPLDIIAHYESGGRNIPQQVIGPQGGYNPSVGRVTGPSSAGGPWQMIDPTWRDAARKTPGAEQYPTAMSAPVEVQRAVAKTLFDEQGYAPWAPYNRNLAQAIGYTGGRGPAGETSGGGAEEPVGWGPTFAQGGPDRVIPSGPGAGGNPMMQAQLAQYAPGGGGGGAAGPAAPGAGALPTMPQVPVPPGVDPAKMNALILELARRNAASEVLGLGNPYNSLLTVLQGSPQYKAAVEAATETARRGAGLPFVGPEKAAGAAAEYPYLVARDINKGQIDAANKELEQLGAARKELAPDGILVPDGQGGTKRIQGTREQAVRSAYGLGVPELGIPPMKKSPTGGAGDGADTPVGVPVLTPGQTTSQQQGAEAGWKALQETHAAELAANRHDQQLGQMAEAMQGFTPGASAELRTRGAAILKDLGLIKGDEVPSAETFQRAARQLQINAAPKGQGSTSNYERELYAEAVPAIVNSPESLAKAIGIAQRLNAYDKQVAAIHRDAINPQTGVPNIVEAQRRIAALGPPLAPGEISALEQIRAGKVPGPGGGASGAAEQIPPGAKPIGTFQGKPVYQMPDGSRKVLQ